MKKIKDEIHRIEESKGNVVLVKKAAYLSLLKELQLLRFKVRKAEDWEPSARVASLEKKGYMYQYWYPEEKEGLVLRETGPAQSDADRKARAWAAFLKENQIEGFSAEEKGAGAIVFRGVLPAGDWRFPMEIVLDPSVYTMIRVQTAGAGPLSCSRGEALLFCNALNGRYAMLRYTVSPEGAVLLTCCIPSGEDHFDPALVWAILGEIQGHLQAVYPEIKEKMLHGR